MIQGQKMEGVRNRTEHGSIHVILSYGSIDITSWFGTHFTSFNAPHHDTRNFLARTFLL